MATISKGISLFHGETELTNLQEIPDDLNHSKLTFEGLVALYDPPRYGVKSSIEECYSAGIRVVMITGDNGETAKGIAKKINLENNDEVMRKGNNYGVDNK